MPFAGRSRQVSYLFLGYQHRNRYPLMRALQYSLQEYCESHQAYAYYSKSLSKNQILTIKNGDDNIVKTANITKDINYIFYSSPDLDKNYKFYINENR